MSRLKHTIGACIVAYALLQNGAVHAATYYVATIGSDSNPGTREQPWRTIAYAVNTMVAGDTTYVRGGTYNEGVVLFRRSGTQSAPIRLLNYPGEGPIIHCHPSSPRGPFNRITIASRGGVNVAIGWITIEGFEIRNCWDGIKIHSGHDLTIRRNWIHDNSNGGQGILTTGTRILIDRNIISHNGSFAACATRPAQCNQDHGIYASGTAYTITNNLIYDNLAYGIQVAGAYKYDPAKYAGPEYVNSADWVIANNTIAYQVNRAAICVWGSTPNLQIVNNIFYENSLRLASSAPQGIDFVSAINRNRVTINNNLAYASGTSATAFLGFLAIEGIHYTQFGNIVNMNPVFVNAPAVLPASPNFALTERSPAIDKGAPLAVTGTAFDGTTRPQGRAYDIGAYEYVPTTSAIDSENNRSSGQSER